MKRILKEAASPGELQEWRQADESHLVAYTKTTGYWLRIICTARIHWFYVIDLDTESVAARYWTKKPCNSFRVATAENGVIHIGVIHSDSFLADASQFTFDPQPFRPTTIACS
ncbi:MAG: hypothetical protein WD972_00140 [Candidatus Andersenbacteria bacterium]